MTVRPWPTILLLLLLASCSILPTPGDIRGAASNPQADPCAMPFLNSQGSLSWFNRSVGATSGFPKLLASLSGTAGVGVGDKLALKLSRDNVGGLASFACYATAHFQDGSSQDGVVAVADHRTNQSLEIQWIDRVTVEQARANYVADTERRQQQGMAYGAKLQACTLKWQVAVQAMSMLRSGMSESAVEEELVTDYAYGPQGLAYRDSQITEAIARQISAAMAMTPEQRALKHMPDYVSQEYLANCQKL